MTDILYGDESETYRVLVRGKSETEAQAQVDEWARDKNLSHLKRRITSFSDGQCRVEAHFLVEVPQ